jgi:hypothetical protein
MNEYRFQYTKMLDTLLVILASMLTFAFTIGILGIIYNDASKNMVFLFSILSLIVALLTFRYLKKFAVRNCTVKLHSDFVVFKFKDNSIRTINFNDLTSYKVYYGNNGPVLYLRNITDRFKLFANDNFCKSKPFETFCKDIIDRIDNYVTENKLNIVHEGSIFQTKGMLLFLTISTPVIFLLFYVTTTDLIESTDSNVLIRIFGSTFLVVFWLKYFIERSRKNK